MNLSQITGKWLIRPAPPLLYHRIPVFSLDMNPCAVFFDQFFFSVANNHTFKKCGFFLFIQYYDTVKGQVITQNATEKYKSKRRHALIFYHDYTKYIQNVHAYFGLRTQTGV